MSENKTIYRNLIYLADTGGTGFWRRVAPITTLNCVSKELKMLNTYTMEPVSQPSWYEGVRSVTVQRWLTDNQLDFVQKFLKPLSIQFGFRLVYEIDDSTSSQDIPIYNRGYEAFNDPKRQENIRHIMEMCDLITVTTTYLKQNVSKRYGIPEHKILAIPNLLPNWWIGDRYDVDKKVGQFQQNKARPRIGIISSLSHFNITHKLDENGKEIQDDIHTVLQTIRETVNDVQWVVLGYDHPELKKWIEEGQIQYHPCIPILQYPSRLNGLGLQAIVAPLQDNEFNRCKSPIKFLEGCALGVPVFCPNMLPYKGVVPENQIYSSQEELKDKLLKLKFSSSGSYKKMIEYNWKWLNSKHEDGNCRLNNYWLESNLGIWIDLFSLPIKQNKNEGETKK